MFDLNAGKIVNPVSVTMLLVLWLTTGVLNHLGTAETEIADKFAEASQYYRTIRSPFSFAV